MDNLAVKNMNKEDQLASLQMVLEHLRKHKLEIKMFLKCPVEKSSLAGSLERSCQARHTKTQRNIRNAIT